MKADPAAQLRTLTDGAGFDDAPCLCRRSVRRVEMADDLPAEDGCLNFFAGPTDSQFKVPFNSYNVHYNSTMS